VSSRAEREGLLARVRQIRRLPAMSGVRPAPTPDEPEPDVLQSLQTRITHLEHQLQGLQDSVHRESSRQSKQISDLEAQIQPAALSRALSQDARERGI
jgi:hypothetical protein